MAVYSGQGRQPFSAAQLALMEEEELRKIAAQRAFNEKMLARNRKSALKNQTAMTQDDVGFFPGLLGRSSEAEQRMLAGNMYPGPQLSLFDRAKNALSDAWTNENSSFKQGLLVDKILDEKELEQEKARAILADQQAGSGQLAQQVWSPGLGAPQIQPRVEEEVNQGVTGIVPPGEFNFSQGKQLSDEEFGRTYYEGAMDASGAIKIPFTDKYIPGQYPYKVAGNSLDPELSYGEMLTSPNFWFGGINEYLTDVWDETRFGSTPGLFTSPEAWANSEILKQEKEQEAKRVAESEAGQLAAAREAEAQRIRTMDDAMSGYGARPTPVMEPTVRPPKFPDLPPYVGSNQALAEIGINRFGGPTTPEQKMYDGLTPDLQNQMDAIREYNAVEEENARIRNMQNFIGQQSEMESGYSNMQEAQAALETVDQSGADNESFDTPIIGEEPISVSSHVLPAVEKKIEELSNDEKNDLFVDKTLRGENLLGKFLDKLGLLDNDNGGVSEADGDATVNDIAVIAAESGDEAAQEAGQAGLLTEDKTTDTKNNNVFNAAVAGSEGASNSGIISATADDSMEGFTMDRFTNPLSPENKKWWLGGGGGVPGSNRAVQFFEALAYIGTPLKYRPSKTPAQQNIENQMTQMNNVMDYRSANTANPPSFAALRAAVPSTKVIENTIRGQMENEADKGFLFGLIGGDSESDIDNDIATTAYAIREKLLQMTLVNTQNGITRVPTIEEAIAAMQPPQTDNNNDDEESEGRFLGFFK